ncbi:nucleoside triphosphate pyrophosphohydrolase [Candidatus Oleimmundimicrobium sp.]|uniref:nucleoside triphosphate pyrophosphohydrolase n=1 Tax=Candidatus Oleimmundimicrobium sp. TaxID=3060597 RepID=UPI0027234943|nr:nucleoside triphosphate pyrophosphohydrolase [Candidatus Oleimmundimicrobium sp.]MDO8886295.1 nucleoside triphosphate pyrophosphohydrolase [Candidatus Oleimmundimicrobium sp.]
MSECFKFKKLTEIISILRGPTGCPWDKEQTYKSLTPHLIEESYEVLEAVNRQNFNHLKEELGDLLLQIVFYAQMASEDGKFNIDDVIDGIIEKLIRRHPHIFADKILLTSKDVLKNWDKIKKKEKEKSVCFMGVQSNLPALMYASKLQSKASRVGFDWQKTEDVFEKLDEEVEEFKEKYREEGNIEEEIGDILFTIVNIARCLKVDSEIALRRAANKFSKRFEFMEKVAEKRGLDFEDLSLAEKDKLWEEAKKLIADGE